MNYSRAGGPIPVNKPGIDKRIDDKMETLLEQEQALQEAITHYTSKVALNDGWKDWYENALGSYERKYDRLKIEIKNTTGVENESAVEPGQDERRIGSREAAPSAKEEGHRIKKS